MFSAWVLWHRENRSRRDAFDWRRAHWSLHVPIVRALYEQIATPGRMGRQNATDEFLRTLLGVSTAKPT